MSKRISLLWCLTFCCLVSAPLSTPAADLERHPMVRELAQAGFSIVRTGEEYQAPFVEIAAPPGLAIYTLCRRVPSLNARFFEARDKIAAFNNLNPFFVRHDEGRPHHFRLPTIKIPLDFTRDPVIFPAYQEGLAAYPQYLLIDIGKCYLALYERGVLVRVYPISPGALNHGNRSRTPLVRFTIQSKAEHKWSSIYDAWMPYSLQVHGPYFIHGGVLPGEPDSKGCIRMFTDHARELFNLVEVGTHGRIVRSGPVAPPPGGTHLAGSR